jgi:hypothetical protein
MDSCGTLTAEGCRAGQETLAHDPDGTARQGPVSRSASEKASDAAANSGAGDHLMVVSMDSLRTERRCPLARWGSSEAPGDWFGPWRNESDGLPESRRSGESSLMVPKVDTIFDFQHGQP